MVVLDTNIIIDHLRQVTTTESLLSKVNKKEGRSALYLSVISIQELFEGKSTKNKSKLKELLSIIAPINILEYNYDIAELAGRLARDSVVPMEFADCAIAATCIFNDTSLFTLNTKHFKQLNGLNLYKL